MAVIYISSTYEDLKTERKAATRAVKSLGHTVIAMEEYEASNERPVKKCLEDVKKCNVYIGIFALRYGHIAKGYEKSITHLEYETARDAGIPCLIFLLDETANWPIRHVSKGEERQKIEILRQELREEHLVKFFTDTGQLTDRVKAAVSKIIPEVSEDWTGIELGKYVVRERLGRGGKGIVYKVFDNLEESDKAIKIVPSAIIESPVAYKQLQKEVKNAAAISHPNVVKVLGLEKYERLYFIVMEYIEGRNLEQILAEQDEGGLNEPDVIEWMKNVALGLHETHENNVIHRDIKPANIMVTPNGRVKILDFGISYRVTKSMTELLGEEHRTGTWPYMAPEQLSTVFGRENEQVDVWGFGVTMYQLLTGELPFRYKEQIKDKTGKPFEPEEVSAKTRDILMRCLEKDRKKRFKNMKEVLEALEALNKVDGLVSISTESESREIPGYIKKVKSRGIKVGKNAKGYWEADYGDGIIMVYILSGEFTMGQTDEEMKWLKDQVSENDYNLYYKREKPLHKVYLDGFRMGKTEVTMKQYKAFISETGHRSLPDYASEYSPGDEHPVIGVSWEDAAAYCKWLSTKTGLIFKLPTEAQWEKGARGTDTRKYPWGDREPNENLANFERNIGKTSPVGSYSEGASPYGLLDMAGNVWEWCADWYDEDYYKHSPKENPPGPGSGSYRVVRGGSWIYFARGLRCADRDDGRPSKRFFILGFRLCQDN